MNPLMIWGAYLAYLDSEGHLFGFEFDVQQFLAPFQGTKCDHAEAELVDRSVLVFPGVCRSTPNCKP